MGVPRLEGCAQLLRLAHVPDDMLHTLAQALQHHLIALLLLAVLGVLLYIFIIYGDDLQAGSPRVAQALAGRDVMVSIQLSTADSEGLYAAYSALLMSSLGFRHGKAVQQTRRPPRTQELQETCSRIHMHGPPQG